MRCDLINDKKEITQLGYRRYKNGRTRGRVPKNIGKPVSPKTDIAALKTEFGIARKLGIEPEMSRSDESDDGYDGVYRGWKYEVKETEHESGKLLYNSKIHTLKNADVWILAITYGLENWYIRIAGWVWVTEMSGLWYRFHHDKDALCIDQENLKAFEEFINVEPKGGKTLIEKLMGG